MFGRGLLWLYLFFLAKTAAYDNLALNKESKQSSTFFDNKPPITANDGNANNSPHYPGNSCIHTLQDTSIQEAWWRVNLGFVTRIQEIKITYRQGFAPRLAGFTIFVSNTSDFKAGTRCYKQNGSLPEVETTSYPCTEIGQYVTVYNDRFSNTTYPSDYNTGGAVLELCEVEVPGCNSSHYGENCGSSCYCKGLTCDYRTGNCDGDCQPGYTGDACNTPCDPGYFGDGCTSQCPNCGGDNKCNQSGVCTHGCETGYFPGQSPGCPLTCGQCVGVACNTDGTCPNGCDDGYYLPTCNGSCPGNCYNRKCHQSSGNCLSCKDGYYGSLCDKTCPDNCLEKRCAMGTGYCLACNPGFYGNTCTSQCPHCGGNKSCDQFGVCTQGCEIGYFPDQTPGCSQVCGPCAGVACNNDGTCPNGCDDGFYLPSCNGSCPVNCNNSQCEQNSGNCLSCKKGYYGTECNQQCPDNCLNGTCMMNTGNCLDCMPGYFGDKCQQGCPNCGGNGICNNTGACIEGCVNDYYSGDSPGCSMKCGHCNGTTCGLDGTCPFGCADGFYSTKCTEQCPANCYNSVCKPDTGACLSCFDGYYTDTCDKECSENCANQVCAFETGNCGACTSTRSGTFCELVDSPGSNPIPAAVGGVVGVLVVVLIIVAVIIVYRRRNNSRLSENSVKYNGEHAKDSVYTNVVANKKDQFDSLDEIGRGKKEEQNVYMNASTVQSQDDNVYSNESDVIDPEAVPVDTFQKYLASNVHEKQLLNEYKSFPSGFLHPHTEAEKSENIRKNRFRATFPYDHSRVILKTEDGRKTDYINANYIDSTDETRKYIATQGPLQNTLGDFWRMAWENDVEKIVMLTNLKELNKAKCDKYWPDPNQPKRYDVFDVYCLDERELSYYVVRCFRVINKTTKEERKVWHFHFTTWPDHGTPNPLQFVMFHRRVEKTKVKLNGPDIVHCSAGIGRTGTFIALDALRKQGEKVGRVNVKKYVEIMRKDRMNMIQTAQQYVVLHEALAESFRSKDTVIMMDEFPSEWESIQSDKKPMNKRRFRVEYDSLISLKRHIEAIAFKAGSLDENKTKNRNPAIKASDKYRPFLSPYGGDRTDYINAVIIPTNIKLVGYIVTQRPLHNTVLDFWQLVEEHDIAHIVLFESDVEEKTVFYPSTSHLDVDNGVIKCKKQTDYSDDVTMIELEKVNNETEEDTHITIYKVNTKKKMLPMATQILKVNELACPWERKDEPLVVISHDGTSPCDVYCTFTSIQESMKIDNEIDVFQMARQLQLRRPEFFGNYESYELCYRTINEHLSADSIYVN